MLAATTSAPTFRSCRANVDEMCRTAGPMTVRIPAPDNGIMNSMNSVADGD